MIFENKKNTFLGIKDSKASDTDVIIVPYPLESSVCYGKGTSMGPVEIIKASHQLELYDEDLNYEPCTRINIKTIKTNLPPKNNIEAVDEIEKIITDILNIKKFPFIFGGEHTVTIGAINAFAKLKQPLTVVQFDAHADLRNEYESNILSHACTMRRCMDLKNINIISIGTRSISKSEAIFVEKNKDRIDIFFAKDKENWDTNKFLELIKNKNVYITFDVDTFDSSIMPATGTPEPGGLLWDEVLKLIKIISTNSNVVGADINELAPIKNLDSCNFLTAKLAYKIISLIFHSKKY
jgi:agmatinase